MWPRTGRQPSQFSTSHWAAEMSSCTDGPEQITNNARRYKTAETRCWRRLILQTETQRKPKKKNWEEKEGREPIGSGTGASGTRHRNICSENLRFSVKSIMFSEHVLLLLLLLLDRRKALAGGKVNRHSLLYSGHFIHLVGLIKRQMLFLDI